MNGKSILIAMCLIFASYGIAGADYLLIDQENMSNVDSWHNLSYYKFDQEFTPSLSSMDVVELKLHTDEEGVALQINILIPEYSICDINDSENGCVIGTTIGTSKVVNLPPGSTKMARFMFASPIQLNPGSSYIIDVELVSGSAFVASGFEGGGYPQGLMYINGCNTPTDNSDLIFQTGNVRSKLKR